MSGSGGPAPFCLLAVALVALCMGPTNVVGLTGGVGEGSGIVLVESSITPDETDLAEVGNQKLGGFNLGALKKAAASAEAAQSTPTPPPNKPSPPKAIPGKLEAVGSKKAEGHDGHGVLSAVKKESGEGGTDEAKPMGPPVDPPSPSGHDTPAQKKLLQHKVQTDANREKEDAKEMVRGLYPLRAAENRELQECNTGKVGQDLINNEQGSKLRYECSDVETSWDATMKLMDPYNTCLCLACGGSAEEGLCSMEEFKALEVHGVPEEAAADDEVPSGMTLTQCNHSPEVDSLAEMGRKNMQIMDCDEVHEKYVWKPILTDDLLPVTQYHRCVCKGCGGKIMEDEDNHEFCKGHKFGEKGPYVPPRPEEPENPANAAAGSTPQAAPAAGGDGAGKQVVAAQSAPTWTPPSPKCRFDKKLAKFLKMERSQAQIMSSQGFVNNFVKRKEIRETYPTAGTEPVDLMKSLKDDESIYYFAYRYARSVNKLRKKLLNIQFDTTFSESRCYLVQNWLMTTALRHLGAMFCDTLVKYRKDTEAHRYSEKPVYALATSIKSMAQQISTGGGKWDELNAAIKRAHMVSVHETSMWASVYKYLHAEDNMDLDDTMLERVRDSPWLKYLPYSTLWDLSYIEKVEDDLLGQSGFDVMTGINFGNEELGKKIGLDLDTTNLDTMRDKLLAAYERLREKAAKGKKDPQKEHQIGTLLKSIDNINRRLKTASSSLRKVQRRGQGLVLKAVRVREQEVLKQAQEVMESALRESRNQMEDATMAMGGGFNADFKVIAERKLPAMEKSADTGAGLEEALGRTLDDAEKQQQEQKEMIKRQEEMSQITSKLMELDEGVKDEDDDNQIGRGPNKLSTVTDMTVKSDGTFATDDEIDDNSKGSGGDQPDDAAALEEASPSTSLGDSDGDGDGDAMDRSLQQKDVTLGMETIEHAMLVKARRSYEEKMSELEMELNDLDAIIPGHLDMFQDMMEGRCKDLIESVIDKTNENLKDIKDVPFRLGKTSADVVEQVRSTFGILASNFKDLAERALRAHHDMYQRLMEDTELSYTSLNGEYQTQYKDEAVSYMGTQQAELEKVRRILAKSIHETVDRVTDFLSDQNDNAKSDDDSNFWNQVYAGNSYLEAKDSENRAKYLLTHDVQAPKINPVAYRTFISQPIWEPEDLFNKMNEIRCPIGYARMVVVTVMQLVDTLEETYKDAVQGAVDELPDDLPNRPVHIQEKIEARNHAKQLADKMASGQMKFGIKRNNTFVKSFKGSLLSKAKRAKNQAKAAPESSGEGAQKPTGDTKDVAPAKAPPTALDEVPTARLRASHRSTTRPIQSKDVLQKEISASMQAGVVTPPSLVKDVQRKEVELAAHGHAKDAKVLQSAMKALSQELADLRDA